MNLKEYLDHFNVTPSEIATAAGVTVQAISQYCLKKRAPRPRIASKIVKATRGQVTYADLYAEVEA